MRGSAWLFCSRHLIIEVSDRIVINNLVSKIWKWNVHFVYLTWSFKFVFVLFEWASISAGINTSLENFNPPFAKYRVFLPLNANFKSPLCFLFLFNFSDLLNKLDCSWDFSELSVFLCANWKVVKAPNLKSNELIR